jgi:hypothetical protein
MTSFQRKPRDGIWSKVKGEGLGFAIVPYLHPCLELRICEKEK